MSRFFEEVKFDPPDKFVDKDKPKPIKIIWDKEQLKAAFLEISNELAKIKNGTSEYTTYAINPGSFGFPAENSMRIFVNDPSDRTFEGIHAICRQDFGARAGDHFHKLLKAARREEEEDSA